MIKKPRKTTANSLKKSLHEIRECLNESLPNFEKKEMVGIKLSVKVKTSPKRDIQ